MLLIDFLALWRSSRWDIRLFLRILCRPGQDSFSNNVSILGICPSWTKQITFYRLWLVSSAMADVLIAISLVITLTRASGRTTIRSTRTLLSRLILTAIQSGTVTSIFAIIVVVTIVTRPTTNDSAYISFSLGHVYNLSMLLNLNLRRRLESRPCSCGRTAPGVSVTNGAVMGAPVGTPAAGPSRGPGELGRSRGDAPAEVYRLSRLHVHQTRSEVHLDDEDLATVLKAEGVSDIFVCSILDAEFIAT